MKIVISLVVLCGISGAVARAEPASGVTATPPAGIRGTYEEFKVKTDLDNLEFKARAETRMDLVVRQHDYDPHGRTGWHRHPGPVFITVVSGTLKFYEYGDQTCTPVVVSAGQGYVDSGHGHLAVNDSQSPATDISVITAPVGQPFRTNIDPPPYCNP